MENNKNKKSVKFQGDLLNFCDFIQVFVFTRNHHLKASIFPIIGKKNNQSSASDADQEIPTLGSTDNAGNSINLVSGIID